MIDRLRQLLRRKFVQDTLALQIAGIIKAGISLVSSVLIARLMGPTAYGEWALTASFFAIWQAFNLTGIGPSTVTRLSAAVGARDSAEALNLLAFYVRVMLLWAVPCIVFLWVVGVPLASYLYTQEVTLPGADAVLTRPHTLIGVMAAVYALILIPDGFYNMVIIALQSRREMRLVAVLQNANAIVLAVSVVGALVISPTLPGMVAGRLVYSVLTMGLALWFYQRVRGRGDFAYPTLGDVLRRARTVALRPYWRFGVAIALDRNLAGLFLQMPIQLVGIFAGVDAAGYVQLALRAINLPNTITAAIFDNMQAVIPQAVGRGDYRRLWQNFNRVLLVLAAGSVVFYGAVVGFVLSLGPVLIPLLYGAAWLPALPYIGALAVFGAVTTVGGVFGPLYRALDMMRAAIAIKAGVIVVGAVIGLGLVDRFGGLGGVWLINLLFSASVLLTALVTLPALRRRAQSAL